MSESQKITSVNFDTMVKNAEGPVLVDFWATWCMPCRMLAPVIDDVASAYAGKLAVGKINVDEEPALAEQFGIMSIPTLILFKNGEAKEKLVGLHPKEAIERMLEPHL